VADRRPATLTGVDDVLAVDRLALHWYGKREVYDLRKMGHVTLVGEQPAELLAAVRDHRDRLDFA
jgi:5-(carboxyamino)imidazole ribonucleotide synthase